MTSADRIAAECDRVKALLLEKNESYGDSALNPVGILSQLGAKERLRVRVDDKISRLRTAGVNGAGEDNVLDLIGYLILLRIAEADGE